MDIHAPHEPVHTWRDFFTHLVIVTIGLFIALTLESGVEYLHHRHIVREARENIRRELEDNHAASLQDLDLLTKNIATERNNVTTLHQLAAHTKDLHLHISNTFDFTSMEDAAWRTARDTGALAYMPYDEVQRYADLYMMADLVNTHAISTAQEDFHAASPFNMGLDADKLPPDTYQHMIEANANVITDLSALRQFVQQYDQQCQSELNRR